ncbi:MAG: lipoprotein-releasing ABC transporter ATP-binding protein LolD [Gammaproteobacteria bacterium]|nr:lipoprotein-releasing ABC transporter ATP-binding protein LolD [Gammaproteobacteria bacterium]MDH5630429.1 lipoprotein-releasing ABC transporter ATP-binding protein LolD [Gammaproteobacteria bacterium]
MSKTVLNCHQVSKTFRDGYEAINVLAGVDLNVEEKQMVAIVGASGSGKSTLLHILGGLDAPDSGVVKIKDQNIHKMSVSKQSQFRNQHLGFIYQFHHLLPEFSALENVAMPLIIGGMSKSESLGTASDIIKRVGLSQRETHRPSALSGGERQRIAIARALVTKPACILADEPTGNLDSKTAHAVQDLMMELNELEKTSFLVVSHDPNLAELFPINYEMVDGSLNLIKG